MPGVPLAMPLFEINVSLVSHVSAILVSILCLSTIYNSGIVTYYSYAGIIIIIIIISFISLHGTEGHTQKARPVQGAYP